MEEMTPAEKKARDQGQLEGLVTALRWVRAALDGTATLPGHGESIVNDELKAIRERIARLQSR